MNIVSTNTSGVRNAVRNIRAAGRRVGIALNPESSVSLLKSVLRDIDEVMIMSVNPGAAGQSFEPSALHKISVLAATRKKYGLRFLIDEVAPTGIKSAGIKAITLKDDEVVFDLKLTKSVLTSNIVANGTICEMSGIPESFSHFEIA